MSTEATDHKAEALKLLERAFELQANEDDTTPSQLVAHEALVHSNLAIAEGQERVAEAVRGLGDLTAVAALIAAVEPFTTDGGVSCGEIERDALVAAYERITDARPPNLRGQIEILRAALKPTEFSTSDASDDPWRAKLIVAIDEYLEGELLDEGAGS